MKQIVKVTLIALCLSGCSTLASVGSSALVGAVTESSSEPLLSVETEVTAGDKNQTGIETHSTQEVEAEVVNIDEGVAFWQAGIAIALAFLLGLFSPQFVVSRK